MQIEDAVIAVMLPASSMLIVANLLKNEQMDE